MNVIIKAELQYKLLDGKPVLRTDQYSEINKIFWWGR